MSPVIRDLGRRLRLGVIGGGKGSFIGPVHRLAARFDDAFEVVAGVLSSDAGRSKALAADLGIAPARAYGDWREMLLAEKALSDGIDVVAIMTPNDLHFEPAELALELGFDIICDKPLTVTKAQADQLVTKTDATGRVFCVTYNYSQYPMVRQARALVKAGRIGAVRQIHTTYVQGHNAGLSEAEQNGTDWRFMAERAGASLILGDIGSHALHLGCYVAGTQLVAVMADIAATVPGREADDYACLLTRFADGSRGSLWVTNSAAGAEHGLSFSVFGEQGGFEWQQETPNSLLHYKRGGFQERQTRQLHGQLEPLAEHATRLEIGHPEGYHDAFAVLYRDVAEVIAARHTGRAPNPLATDFPTVLDGARGMAFIEAAVRSHQSGCWVEL